jgi:creatinine amidohydrolase
MMLRLRSTAVRAERAVAGPCEPIERLLDRLIAESVRGVSESGVLGDPSGASGQQGEELLSGMAVQLAGDIRTWRVSKQGRLGSRSPTPAPAQPGVRA